VVHLKYRKKLVIWSIVVLILISGSLISCLSRLPSIWKPDYRILDHENFQPVKVGFACMQEEPDDAALYKMIDEVIYQVFGEKGLRAIIKKGDKVVIKINLAGGPSQGLHGQKGRGTITDPRIVRYIAEKVRDIIGWEEPAGIIVAEALFNSNPNPSLKKDQLYREKNSFYLARLERHGEDTSDRVDPNDFCLDYNADGILDGSSGAVLVNLDSIGLDRRFLTIVQEPTLGETKVYLPNILRTKEQAHGDKEYCDVLIGLPILKSHLVTGLTGALKLHYGFRCKTSVGHENGGRWDHSGFNMTGDVNLLGEYLSAQHQVRTYDFVLMDAITGDRRGPHNLRYDHGFENPVDYILINSLLASTDSVAIDTAAALLAGYKPESIPASKIAAMNGVGIFWPEWIRLEGSDAFSKHRQFLLKEYNPERMRTKYEGRIDPQLFNWTGHDINPWMPVNNIGVFGSYPFTEWGMARNLDDSDYKAFNSARLQISRQNDHMYQWKYSISSEGRKEKDVARVDFLVNGNPVGFRIKSKWDDVYTTDLSGFHGNVVCRLTAWDYRLNCTLSEAVTIRLP
jgi:uncharacterized protein (DUF362 family)